MKDILRIVQQKLRYDGFINITHAEELRKYVWQKDNALVTILLNHPMTKMIINYES